MNRKAFTIVEVLVSITLIMILMMIMLPVFSKAKDRSYETVCISNLRQMYTALKLYESDHDGYPPRISWPGFKSYYPIILRCKSSKQEFGEYDYLDLFAEIPNPTLPSELEYLDQWKKCKALRGPAFPVAIDHNHSLAEFGHFLILREDGSVNTKPYNYNPQGPCPNMDDRMLNF